MNDNIHLKYFKSITQEKYFPVYILLVSTFVLFFRLNGSIVGWDEGIYSQIAKEGLLSNVWIDLYYRGHLWFEKPPLVIWLTMISYMIFGINEFAVWFFPVIFGIIGVLATYYLANNLFNAKIGFFSSIILLSIPHYVLMSRNNMTDIFLLTFSLLSFIFLIKSRENSRYFVLSGIFLGLAFLSKNFISFLFIPIFLMYIYTDNRLSIFKSKHFYWFIVSFLVVAFPWHFIMILKYKWSFLDEYVGYHLIERYRYDILNSIQSSDLLHYIKVIALRSGSWWFVFITTLPVIFFDIKNNVDRKKLLLLLFWFILPLLFFTSSVTKLHHYILILYIPFAILIAYGLYYSYVRRSVLLLPILVVLLMNVNSPILEWVSDYGESKLLAAFILNQVFQFPVKVVSGLIIIFIGYVCSNYFLRSKTFALRIALTGMFLFSMIIPFKPDRAPLAKKIGEIALKADTKYIYYFDYSKASDNLEGSLVFYSYPIPIKSIYEYGEIFYEKNSSSSCLINKSDYGKTKKLDYEYYPCEVRAKNVH